MSFKEHIKFVMSRFFVIAALTNLAIFIIGEIFQPDQRFGYEAFLYPLIYAAIATVPMLCIYSPKELTIKQYILKKLLLLISIEILLVIFVLGAKSLEPGNITLTVSFALSVLIIFVLVHVIAWVLDWETAKKLNSDLKMFRNRVENI